VDDAVADTDQLASSDVERAFAAGCGGALDGHDVSVANGDVEQLGAEGTPGQRSRLRQEVVADLSPSAVFASDRAPTGEVPKRVRRKTVLGCNEVDVCHRLVKRRATTSEASSMRSMMTDSLAREPPYGTPPGWKLARGQTVRSRNDDLTLTSREGDVHSSPAAGRKTPGSSAQ